DPDCQDASTPDRCAATAGKRYQQSRLGWAAQTLGETCYESNGRPRRYSALCERRYSWGTAREDYVLPDAHTVSIRIAPQQLGGTNGECTWSWQARKAGGKTESKRTACTDKLTIARVPYALDRTQSGVAVTVKLPDGRELVQPEVVVEAVERFYGLGSPECLAAFEKASARWLSRDCHRSQYGYPFRVAIELALEDRHRAVTLASFTCSGAEVTEGLFLDMPAREGASEVPGGKVRAQLDQLSDLICRGPRSQSASYTLPTYAHASTRILAQRIDKTWCPPQSRKRAIDVVLMSIGGNDVGFSALAAYSLTETMADLAPIAGLIGSSSRFGPQVARAYLEVLDERMKALKEALRDSFGVTPPRVVHT